MYGVKPLCVRFLNNRHMDGVYGRLQIISPVVAQGARVGVLRQVISLDNNTEVMQLFQNALDLMSSKGTALV